MNRQLRQLIDEAKNERRENAILQLIHMDFVRRSLWKWVRWFPFARDDYDSIINFVGYIAVIRAVDKYDESKGDFEPFIDGEIHNAMCELAENGAAMYPIRVPHHEISNVTAFARAMQDTGNAVIMNGEIDFEGNRGAVLREIANKLSTEENPVSMERAAELERWYRLSHHRESLYQDGEGCMYSQDAARALERDPGCGFPGHDPEMGVSVKEILSGMTNLEKAVVLLRGEGFKKWEIAEILSAKFPGEGIDGKKVDNALRSAKKKLRVIL